MLNKPTNVSPYNAFIDINKGLDLSFSLSNPIDYINIKIYDDRNFLLYEGQHSASNSDKNFSFSVPSETLEKMSNGRDYYWRIRYWRDDSLDDVYQINGWDEDEGLLGVFVQDEIVINNETPPVGSFNGMSEGTIDRHLDLGALLPYLYTYKDTINEAIASMTSNYYLYFYKDGSITYAEIDRIDSDGRVRAYDFYHNGEELTSYSSISDKLKNTSVKLFRLNANLINYKDRYYLGLKYKDNDVVLHTIGDAVEKIHNGIPSVWVSVDTNDLGLATYDADGAVIEKEDNNNMGIIRDDITAQIFLKNFNESPSYYFSCRDKIEPEIITTINCSPQLKAVANFKQYTNINYYYYQIYQLHNGSKWNLVWESDRFNSCHESNEEIFGQEVCYNELSIESIYKIKVIGLTNEGMSFESETNCLTENFFESAEMLDKSCLSFNKQLGCVIIDNSCFASSAKENAMHIYRHNIVKNKVEPVLFTEFSVDSVTTDDINFKKITKTYDFNVFSGVEYVYYIYIIDENDSVARVYKTPTITPTWFGVYLTDLTALNLSQYNPDLSNAWFIELNYSPSDIMRTYQVSHPIGLNQKHPKSVRGKANFKSGTVSGLIGTEDMYGDYNEGIFDIDEFDSFCSNGKLKLLRSSTKGEVLVADIDSLSSSTYGEVATSISLAYTQIDDIDGKIISKEV